MPRLRTSDPSLPGWRRRRRGRGFSYEDERGAPLVDPAALERIRGLAIPPAWREVWICPWPNGHIQAIGVDAAGRRQYLYHPAWREARDAEKFERMLEVARALPRLRAVVAEDLVRDDLPRERVLACATRLLDRCFFRIGGEAYAEENETFGLATLQRRHVQLDPPATILFDYVAKGGVERSQRLTDPGAYAVVEALKRRRGGHELLAWREGRRWCDVRSSDINRYVREAAGVDATAKDFRTWHATVLGAVSIAVLGAGARSERQQTAAIARAIGEVSHYLGNTPAVCRASYVDPRVFEHFRAGRTIAGALGRLQDLEGDRFDDALAEAERAVVRLLSTEVRRSRRGPGRPARRGRGTRPDRPVGSARPALAAAPRP
ncbi:MAG: DNA topoisomerase IB [Thermoleophilia bacterium]